jgi:VanZ family protein
MRTIPLWRGQGEVEFGLVIGRNEAIYIKLTIPEIHIQTLKKVYMWRFIKDYLFSILFILIVAYLSLSQPPRVIIPLIRGWDKVVHFCMYGGLSGVIWIEYLLNHRKKKISILHAMIAGVVIPVLFGGCMEFCQHYFTRYRSGDWVDFLANMKGVVVVTLIAWFLLRPLIMKNTVFKKDD